MHLIQEPKPKKKTVLNLDSQLEVLKSLRKRTPKPSIAFKSEKSYNRKKQRNWDFDID